MNVVAEMKLYFHSEIALFYRAVWKIYFCFSSVFIFVEYCMVVWVVCVLFVNINFRGYITSNQKWKSDYEWCEGKDMGEGWCQFKVLPSSHLEEVNKIMTHIRDPNSDWVLNTKSVTYLCLLSGLQKYGCPLTTGKFRTPVACIKIFVWNMHLVCWQVHFIEWQLYFWSFAY
jgi:hypothetical protein